MFLEKKEIHPLGPRAAIDLGIGFLTEDRNKYGLMLNMSVKENTTISNLGSLRRGLFIDRRAEELVAAKFVNDLKIKTPHYDQSVDQLSGGNRQKVILARWLSTSCKLLIFDEPTAGIDVGMKYEIYLLINELARKGIGIIIISSDLPEILGMCDRVAVMWDGKLTGILDRTSATQEKIMMLATGQKNITHAA